MLAARSLVHQARALFSKPPRKGPLPQAEAALTRLNKKSPEKTYGRHVFLAEAYAALRSVLAAGGQPFTNELRLKVMREHSAMYKTLPFAQRRRYEDLASTASVQRRALLNEDILHAEALVGMARRRVTEESLAAGQQCILANARFSDHDLAAMAAHWNASDFSMVKVMAYRASAMIPPETPSLAEQASLAAQRCDSICNSPAAQIDDWVRKICAHRNALRGCAILGPVGGESRAFVVLFATQKPLEVALSPLHRVHRVMPDFGNMPLPDQRAWVQKHFDHDFSVQFGVSQLYSHGLFDEGGDIEVFTSGVYLHGPRFCSHFDPIPLDEFCASLPRATEKKRASSNQQTQKDRMDPELLRMYPWLEKYESQNSPGHHDRPFGASGPELPTVETPELDEELVRKTWELLEQRRREWAEEDNVHTTDFETFIRGGKWVQTHAGTAYDCIIGRPCSEPAREWVQMYFQNKTAAFAYKRYGEEAANMLALGWCHRMQYFFNLYADSQSRPFRYQKAELDAYEPEPAYAEWLAKLPAGSPAHKRHAEIMISFPAAQLSRGLAASSSSSMPSAQY
jgi:hypothetical protein